MIDYIIAFLKDIFCFKNRKIKNISIENAKKLEKVRKEIERCMGTHFDPDIAKYMLDMIDDDKDYKLRE